MNYKTSQDLVQKQITYWDQDFYLEGDKVSEEIEWLELSSLTLDQSLISSYTEDTQSEDQRIIKDLVQCLSQGTSLPPLLVDPAYHLIDGYHRVLACKELKITKVPVIKLNRRVR